jgi:16S rRNA (guanine527-N7)-methyltransferase
MEIIKKYFPELTPHQLQQYEQLAPLYKEWNEQINVISRKDIDNIYLHHVLHSLSLIKYIKFKPGSNIVDLGTGGGFPGIPLAIYYPDCQFYLVDSIGKKLKVVDEVASAIGLTNVKTSHSRVEDVKNMKFDFVVTRAVATIDKLVNWSRKSISQKHINSLPNGILALKGGNIKEELKLLPKGEYSEVKPIINYIPEEYFNEKSIVYVQG